MPRNDKPAKPLLSAALSPFGYNNLPPDWQTPDLEKFSAEKTLYGYQQKALENALLSLWLYYEHCGEYHFGEPQMAEQERRDKFAELLNERAGETHAAPKDILYGAKERAFPVLAERLSPQDGRISFERLTNRMSFWMATGSGKTLVMLKLAENLRRLAAAGKIPERKILILAPSDLLLRQIQTAAREYNRANHRPLDLVNLRDWRSLSGRGRDAIFYHRSDNIADERKKALVDWRDFENNGEWYVLLDEAHRGEAQDSKRQAYYSLFARAGFLFNFSATFTDREDIMTTAAKFNLADFTADSYGKHIRLCGAEFRAFNAKRKDDHDDGEKQRIVLQSMLALALVKKQITQLRAAAEQANIAPPYHNPLMVTLTNSVNTPESDLSAFFKVLTGLASPGGLDANLFREAKRELAEDLRQDGFMFESGAVPEGFADAVESLDENEVRRAVFLAESPGALEVITGEPKKELAIKLRTAEQPFGLIRIGETSKWQRYAENAGITVTKSVSERPFFQSLEESDISVLMGSRAFFESWDSVRPNVINFINIGTGNVAVKFIVQSVGRGVRIRPSPPPKERRRRIAAVADKLSDDERGVYTDARHQTAVAAAESLFIFAAKRNAIQKALIGLNAEAGEEWESVGDLFTLNKRPVVGGSPMTLLAPDYEDKPAASLEYLPLMPIAEDRLKLIRGFVAELSDGVLAAAHGKTAGEIAAFREIVKDDDAFNLSRQQHRAATPPELIKLAFSHPRICGVKTEAEVRPLRENGDKSDIVHFKHVKISLPNNAALLKGILRTELDMGENAIEELALARAENKITEEQVRAGARIIEGKKTKFPELTVRRLAAHYYAPLVSVDDDKKAAYIRHIVKTESEAAFLEKLENNALANENEWDGWMFSKLDEATDKIHIPYSDGGSSRKFYPDFIFWMCRGNDYNIVFVDPKGTEHTGACLRLDGYEALFEKNNARRQFQHKQWNVTVGLYFFSDTPDKTPAKYRRHWTQNPADIFTPPAA